MPNTMFRVTLASGALALVMTVPQLAAAQDSGSYRMAPRGHPKPRPTPTPSASPTPAAAQTPVAPPPPPPPPPPPMVGGAPMLPTNTIVQNASAASNLTTLVTAVKAAGLDTTLAGPGPFTVFAPDNDAFSRLPAGAVDTLLKPESKATLTKILTYHVVPGTMTFADLKAKVTAGGGTAQLVTVEGEPLTVGLYTLPAGETIVLTSTTGIKSYVTQGDVKQANGIVHVVNAVLSPKLP